MDQRPRPSRTAFFHARGVDAPSDGGYARSGTFEGGRMRRRWIWTTFLSAAFVLGTACIMTLAGLMKALSFGMYDGAELEHDLAVWVTWPAFGFAVVMLAVGAWRRRRMDDPR